MKMNFQRVIVSSQLRNVDTYYMFNLYRHFNIFKKECLKQFMEKMYIIYSTFRASRGKF